MILVLHRLWWFLLPAVEVLGWLLIASAPIPAWHAWSATVGTPFRFADWVLASVATLVTDLLASLIVAAVWAFWMEGLPKVSRRWQLAKRLVR